VVFKLNTKQPVSVNRVDIIPTTEAVINTVNNIGEQEEQPEGIEFSDMCGGITLQDFADNDNDEDSNVSDDDFELDKEYQEEVDNEIALEEEEGDVGNDDPDSQEDYFQNPIQQHESNVRDNNEAISAIIPKSKGGANPIVTLSNTTVPTEKQECGKRKKKNTDDDNASVEESLEDDNISDPNSIKVGVSDVDDANDDTSDYENEKEVPKELNSDLGPYWTLAQSTCSYVLNTITSYSNIEASKSTPHYGFKRGLKEFGTPGYEATVKELDDNLLGMGAVKMLKPSEINKSIRYEALTAFRL
jgi:hypothetical protein